MSRRWAIVVLVVGLWQAPSASAMDFILSNMRRAINNTGTEYNTISGTNGWDPTENIQQQIAPRNGTIKNLRVILDAAPNNGAGTQSYVFTVRKNSSSVGAPTCTISEAATSCTDLTTSLSVAAGDTLGIQKTIVGTPKATNARFSLIGVGTVSQEEWLLGNNNCTTGTATEYSIVNGGGQCWGTTESSAQQVVSAPGTLSSLYMKLNTAPDSGVGTQTSTFTVMVNGVASAITCSISEAATTCNDTANTASIAAGDLIDLRHTVTSTPTASVSHWGLKFAPANDRNAVFISGASAASTTVVNYGNLVESPRWNATESNIQGTTAKSRVKNLFVNLVTDPQNGAGVQSYAYVVMLNGATTSITCTVSEGSTTCNDQTHTVVVADDDQLSVRSTPANTPASSVARVGVSLERRRRIW